MTSRGFGWSDLFAGQRFLVPVSEETLLEAGRAAGLAAGETLVEVACGNGAVLIFLAEEFHVYARGVDAAGELLAQARDHAGRSRAGQRLRFLHEDPAHIDGRLGPVDVACALRDVPAPPSLLRRGGRMLLGRYVARGDAAPPEIAESFTLARDPPPGEIVWRHEATPLEWERFLTPQERALRAYRRELRSGEAVSPIALATDRRIDAVRAHGAFIAYELIVCTVPGTNPPLR